MRTTVNLDDQLIADARELTGINETSVLLREALKRMIAHEAARQLAAMGGSDPDAALPPRRRFS